MNWKHTLVVGGMLLSTCSLQASTYYVATTGSDTTGNGSSLLPYQTIQAAVNQAVAGDLILVGPGTYQDGEQTTVPVSGKSRVVITKNVTVRSLQGAQQTIIRGKKNSETLPYGANSVRCVYMTAGVLDGFTVLDGYAAISVTPRSLTEAVSMSRWATAPRRLITVSSQDAARIAAPAPIGAP